MENVEMITTQGEKLGPETMKRIAWVGQFPFLDNNRENTSPMTMFYPVS